MATLQSVNRPSSILRQQPVSVPNSVYGVASPSYSMPFIPGTRDRLSHRGYFDLSHMLGWSASRCPAVHHLQALEVWPVHVLAQYSVVTALLLIRRPPPDLSTFSSFFPRTWLSSPKQHTRCTSQLTPRDLSICPSYCSLPIVHCPFSSTLRSIQSFLLLHSMHLIPDARGLWSV